MKKGFFLRLTALLATALLLLPMLFACAPESDPLAVTSFQKLEITENGKIRAEVTLSLADGDIVEYGDIIALNESDGSFLEFFVLPSDGAGTNDARKIVVTLTDVYNPEIQLSVIMQCAPNSLPLWIFPVPTSKPAGVWF